MTLAAHPRDPLQLGAVLADRYRVTGVIGRGGMATVFAADDALLGRRVAIKVFAARADTAEELRVQEAEAKLVAALNHHALVTLYDAGVDVRDPAHPQIYLVMERIDGLDLKEHLLQRGPLAPVQVAYLAFDLAEALGHVHRHGFLHRDIKPANVLIAHEGADTRPRGKLTDFGIASIIGADHDSEFTTGTAAYLSPEQVEQQEPTRASDVYALGLVLLEALTARVAYPGGVEQSAYARLDRQPEVPAGTPPRLADALRGMTARQPEHRPSTTEVAAAMQDLLIEELAQRRGLDTGPVNRTEIERVAAVHRYNVLDTPPDDAFDQITRIASRLLNVPIALVSIIDADRVWHKSKLGTEIVEVERNISFCATTNPGTGPWSIPDATRDPRTRENPIVTSGPEVRAYAAAPLVTYDGHTLGAVCVYDYEPHQFSETDLGDLRDLAGIVMREMELRLASRRALFDR